VDCYGNNYFGQADDYTGGDAIGVSAGYYHTCVLTLDGNVECYGDSYYDQAADYTWGNAVGVSAGFAHSCVLTSDGNVDCYGLNSTGQSEDYIGVDAVGVSAGSDHTCILISNGNIDCYGYGQDYTGGDVICIQTIPLPTSKQSFFYSAVPTRIMNMNPNMAKPVGVGSIAQDGWYLAVNIGLFRFSGLIDMYGAYTVSTDPQTVNVLNPNGSSFTSFTMDEIQNALSTGVPPVGAQPLKANTEGPIYNINLLGNIPVQTLPSGTYTVYLLVTPAGSLSNYYLWITSFVIPDSTFITWEKTLGGTNGEVGSSVQQTSDGGYIIAGRTYSNSFYELNSDIYLVKTDEYGNVLWEKTYGITGRDVGNSVQQTSDGGYIIAGTTSFFGLNHDSDVYLIKTDGDGTVEWEKTFGGEESDSGYSVQQTFDGGYIIAGQSVTYYEDYSFTSDVYLIKTDTEGNAEWEKTFRNGETSSGNSVQQTSDGGYIVAGHTGSYGAIDIEVEEYDVYLIKTDAVGNAEWEKTFRNGETNSGNSVQQTSDGGYIIAGITGPGYRYEFFPDKYDVYLIKTDAEGNAEWEKTHGGESYDAGSSVQQTTDSGYIIAGNTLSYGASFLDVYLLKTDEDGTVVWEKTFGGEDDSYSGSSVKQTSDGGYIIAGYKGWYDFDGMSTPGDDLYLIKTDAEGDI
jgi:hypothetical protein